MLVRHLSKADSQSHELVRTWQVLYCLDRPNADVDLIEGLGKDRGLYGDDSHTPILLDEG